MKIVLSALKEALMAGRSEIENTLERWSVKALHCSNRVNRSTL
jgi:hypothetical protein